MELEKEQDSSAATKDTRSNPLRVWGERIVIYVLFPLFVLVVGFYLTKQEPETPTPQLPIATTTAVGNEHSPCGVVNNGTNTGTISPCSNRVATATWTNSAFWEETWDPNTRTATFVFTFSEGMLPNKACFTLHTDATVEQMATFWNHGFFSTNSLQYFYTGEGIGGGCPTPLQSIEKLEVVFDRKPGWVKVELK